MQVSLAGALKRQHRIGIGRVEISFLQALLDRRPSYERVAALDKDGKPAHSLRRENFRLFEYGKYMNPQPQVGQYITSMYSTGD
jgi:hypothetical protein